MGIDFTTFASTNNEEDKLAPAPVSNGLPILEVMQTEPNPFRRFSLRESLLSKIHNLSSTYAIFI